MKEDIVCDMQHGLVLDCWMEDLSLNNRDVYGFEYAFIL